jgi:hypothetical protein
VDEVVSASVKKAAANFQPGFANCLSSYLHVPESLMQLISQPVNPTATQKGISDEERRLRAQVKLLKGAEK